MTTRQIDRIVLYGGIFKKKHTPTLQEAAPGAEVIITNDLAEALAAVPEAQVYAGMSEEFTPDIVRKGKKLKWIQALSAGVEAMLIPEIVHSPLLLTNVAGIHAQPIAEHVLAMILAFSRRFPAFFRQQGQATWQQLRQDEVTGRNVLVIGFGHIGQAVAHRCRAFDMRVLAVRRHPAPHPLADSVLPPEELHTGLAQADYVVLAVPLTADTKQLIGTRELAAMKGSAYLINVSRGDVVDEEALIAALQDGTIAGAGLDVFAQEPLPPKSPFWRMENVIVTPHQAGGTPHYNKRAMALFADNLRRYLAGEPLINVVDKQLGY